MKSFMYNNTNTTIKWAWLTDESNPYWDYFIDFEPEDNTYWHVFRNSCNGYFIYITLTKHTPVQWVDAEESTWCNRVGYELHGDTEYIIHAEVSKGNSTVQTVRYDPADMDEATHVVEELAFKATKWCLNH